LCPASGFFVLFRRFGKGIQENGGFGMNRRLLSIILAMVLSLSLAPTAAVAQETLAEAEGSIEEATQLEEGGEETALQEASAGEQPENSNAAALLDLTAEMQSESSTKAVIPDDTSEAQSGDSTEISLPIESVGSNAASDNTSSASQDGNQGTFAEMVAFVRLYVLY
jgi:hypothetical protein